MKQRIFLILLANIICINLYARGRNLWIGDTSRVYLKINGLNYRGQLDTVYKLKLSNIKTGWYNLYYNKDYTKLYTKIHIKSSKDLFNKKPYYVANTPIIIYFPNGNTKFIKERVSLPFYNQSTTINCKQYSRKGNLIMWYNFNAKIETATIFIFRDSIEKKVINEGGEITIFKYNESGNITKIILPKHKLFFDNKLNLVKYCKETFYDRNGRVFNNSTRYPQTDSRLKWECKEIK